MTKFVILTVPFNDVRDQSGLELLFYSQTSIVTSCTVDRPVKTPFPAHNNTGSKVIYITYFLSEMFIYGPGVRKTTVLGHILWSN